MNHSMQDAQQSMTYTLETVREMALDREMTGAGIEYRKEIEAMLKQNQEAMAKLTQGIEAMQASIDVAAGKGDKQSRQKTDKELSDKLDSLAESARRMSDAADKLQSGLSDPDGFIKRSGGGKRE
jgi:hypothetical protein